MVPRTEQTLVQLTSEPDADVLVDGMVAGRTPVSVPLTYRGSIEHFERKVSLWYTQPGLSVFLTLMSLGVYLPLSLIPLDPEERFEPVARFENNRFVLRLERSGYVPWERTFDLAGEKSIDVDADLVPIALQKPEDPL